MTPRAHCAARSGKMTPLINSVVADFFKNDTVQTKYHSKFGENIIMKNVTHRLLCWAFQFPMEPNLTVTSKKRKPLSELVEFHSCIHQRVLLGGVLSCRNAIRKKGVTATGRLTRSFFFACIVPWRALRIISARKHICRVSPRNTGPVPRQRQRPGRISRRLRTDFSENCTGVSGAAVPPRPLN
jgi:hypothetical protein